MPLALSSWYQPSVPAAVAQVDGREEDEHTALRGLIDDPLGVGEVGVVGRREIAWGEEGLLAVTVRRGRAGELVLDEVDQECIETPRPAVVEILHGLLARQLHDERPGRLAADEEGRPVRTDQPAGCVSSKGECRLRAHRGAEASKEDKACEEANQCTLVTCRQWDETPRLERRQWMLWDAVAEGAAKANQAYTEPDSARNGSAGVRLAPGARMSTVASILRAARDLACVLHHNELRSFNPNGKERTICGRLTASTRFSPASLDSSGYNQQRMSYLPPFGRRLRVLLLVSLSSGAIELAAQTQPIPTLPSPEPPAPTGPAASAPTTATAETSRPSVWDYALGAGLGWESNVGMDTGQGPSDFTGRLRGNLAYTAIRPNGEIRIAGGATGFFYAEQTQFNRADGNLALDLRRRFSAKTNGNLGLGASYSHSDSTDVLIDQGLLLPLTRTIAYSATAGLTHQASARTDIRAAVRAYRVDFPDSEVLQDSNSVRLSLGAGRRLNESNTLSLESSAERADLVSGGDASTSAAYWTYYVSSQWTHVFSPRTAVLLEAGTSYTPDGETAGLGRSWSFFGGASVSRSVKRTRWTAFYRREVVPRFGLGGLSVADRVGLSASVPLGQRWEASVGGNYAREAAMLHGRGEAGCNRRLRDHRSARVAPAQAVRRGPLSQEVRLRPVPERGCLPGRRVPHAGAAVGGRRAPVTAMRFVEIESARRLPRSVGAPRGRTRVLRANVLREGVRGARPADLVSPVQPLPQPTPGDVAGDALPGGPAPRGQARALRRGEHPRRDRRPAAGIPDAAGGGSGWC